MTIARTRHDNPSPERKRRVGLRRTTEPQALARAVCRAAGFSPRGVPKADGVAGLRGTAQAKACGSGSTASRKLKPAARGVRDARRPGSVLVFVMAILGVLFVLGITFMSMMNFESQMIDAERQRGETTPNVEDIVDDVGRTLDESLQVTPNAPAVGDLLGPSGSLFAEMPGVHNFFAPIEPYRYEAADGIHVVYPWFTDPVAMQRKQKPIGESQYRNLEPNTQWISGLEPNDPSFPSRRCGGLLTGPPCTMDLDCTVPDTCEPVMIPVDADGDGIVDAMEIDASEFGIGPSQVRALSKTLNSFSKPDGKVYLGLRVIAHGAMVNINDSHPTLLRNILSAQDLAFEDTFHPPYSPLVEEAALRRKNFLPAQQLPATRIQGNPLNLIDPDNPGGGDYALRLLPPGESLLNASSLEANHRFWPFGPEEIDASVDPDRPIWSVRMDPEYASAFINDDEYDRRHLITTISHDDLLRRDVWVTMDTGGGVYKRVDIFDLMAQANDQACAAGDPLPFDYLNYPNSVADTYRMKNPPGPGDPPLTWCECRAEPGCTFNPRKGRLRLSLPWLQKQVDSGAMTQDLEIRLIQDAFTLLLLNARGPEWGHYESIDADGDGMLDVPADFDGDGIIDPVPQRWVPFDADPASPLTPIARTAAALTANLIDFADDDDGVDVPTEVPLRSADYTDPTRFGRPLDSGESVFGLERQPFITEVVASALPDGSDPDVPDLTASFFGVELFNPYDTALSLNDYALRIDGAMPTSPMMFSFPIPSLVQGRFVGFYGGVTVPLGSTSGRDLRAVTDLWFDERSKIELVWRPPGTGLEIVVDEVDLSVQTSPPANSLGFWNGTLRSSQRIAHPLTPWTAPIPEDLTDPSNIIVGESFIGIQHARANTESLPPVEVLFAIPNDRTSCGGDSKGMPCTSDGDCPETKTCDPVPWSLETAFPTTGSLLLLMRHANSRVGSSTSNKAFTTYLRETRNDVPAYDAASNSVVPGPRAEAHRQIDNGRMPIFDPGMLHHIDPKLVEPIVGLPAVLTDNQPGGLEHLPWGQLVFDYFTALPLQSDGPYVDADGNGGIDSNEINDHASPKVDLDGLRVHGRININAAPWKVLEGLPFVPMEQIPEPFRTRFRDDVLFLDPAEDDIAHPIGNQRAEAIVAYRGLRNITDTAGATGNYGDAPDGTPDPNGRSWTLDSPMERRGTGFMTVGELANVRHNAASGDPYRIDSGVVGRVDLGGNPDEDYLDAVAVLVSLGDWVTVRSQVFTIYGSLRGEPEEGPGPMSDKPDELEKQKRLIEEVNGRALRFQETIDRLPTVIGSREPVLVGERSITPYNEVLND